MTTKKPFSQTLVKNSTMPCLQKALVSFELRPMYLKSRAMTSGWAFLSDISSRSQTSSKVWRQSRGGCTRFRRVKIWWGWISGMNLLKKAAKNESRPLLQRPQRQNHARALFVVSRDIVHSHSNSARSHAVIVDRATAKPFSVYTVEESALEITSSIEYQSVHLPDLFRLMMNSFFSSLLLDVPTLSWLSTVAFCLMINRSTKPWLELYRFYRSISFSWGFIRMLHWFCTEYQIQIRPKSSTTYISWTVSQIEEASRDLEYWIDRFGNTWMEDYRETHISRAKFLHVKSKNVQLVKFMNEKYALG